MPFGVGGIVIFIVIPFVNFLLYFVFPFGIMTSQRTGKANTARQRPAESWNRTEEAPTSTSSASASLWEREARDGRKWGDVKTKGPSGAGARKGVMWNGVLRKDAR